jgi:hypothetical protein
MAHFAEINDDNIVVRVLVVDNENEDRGQEFLADNLGLGGTWIQTSYMTCGNVHYSEDNEDRVMVPDSGVPLRYNFAEINGHYDPDADAFYDAQPHASWVLNENFVWEPPVSRPADKHIYEWDEDTTSWVKTWHWNEDSETYEEPT